MNVAGGIATLNHRLIAAKPSAWSDDVCRDFCLLPYHFTASRRDAKKLAGGQRSATTGNDDPPHHRIPQGCKFMTRRGLFFYDE